MMREEKTCLCYLWGAVPFQNLTWASKLFQLILIENKNELEGIEVEMEKWET